MQALKRSVLGAVFAFLLGVLPAQSTTYQFSFLSNTPGELTANGFFEVDGLSQITLISGIVGGSLASETIDAVVPPIVPFPGTSSNGLFTYNNHFYATSPHVDFNGLLFTTLEGSFWNLWFDSASSVYMLSTFRDNAFLERSGTFNVAETPLPGALVLFLTGLAGWGALGRLRRWRNVASPALS